MRASRSNQQRRRCDDHEPFVQLGLAPVVNGCGEERREHEHVEQRPEQLRLRIGRRITCTHAQRKPGERREQSDRRSRAHRSRWRNGRA